MSSPRRSSGKSSNTPRSSGRATSGCSNAGLLGVGLTARRGALKGFERLAVLLDSQQRGIRRDVALEAVGVGELRYQAAVGEARAVAVAEPARLAVAGE